MAKINASEYCVGCEYYEKRGGYAQAMSILYGHWGHWDFKQCYKTCYKRIDGDSEEKKES